MKHIKFLSAIFVIAVILSSCKGDTGPAGPAGANGTNGAANITVNTYLITPGNWGSVSTGFYGVSATDINLTNATSDGLESFISTDNTTWFGMPSSNFISNGDQISYYYKDDVVNILYEYSSAPTIDLYLKVVVIPPAIMKRHPNTNWNSYTEVNAVQQAETANAK